MTQRTPTAKAEVSGAIAKNAGRFKGRGKPKRTRPIGEPYKAMTELECTYWAELTRDMPWLNSTHRILLKMACMLSAQMDTEPEFGISRVHALSSLLSKLGATPVDESKVNHGNDDTDGDESDGFFSRPH